MGLRRFSIMKVKEGRETIFIEAVGYPKGSFREDVQRYANGFLNSHGGVIYFGVSKSGIIKGREISRKEEDEFRLVVDHVFGSFQPFVSVQHYRLTFTPVDSCYCVIELKVSIGEIGEIYEDGTEKVFVIDAATLIGPLYPQELKELILLKYKQSIEGAEEAKKYCTPYLVKAKMVAKTGKKTADEVKNQVAKKKEIITSAATTKHSTKSKSSNTENKQTLNNAATANSKGYASKSVTHIPKTVSKETVNDNTNKSNNNESSGNSNISGIKYGSSTIGSNNIYIKCNPSPRLHSYSTRNILSSVTPKNSHRDKPYTPYNQNTALSSNYNHPIPASQPRLTTQTPSYYDATFQPSVQNSYRTMRQLLQYGNNFF